MTSLCRAVLVPLVLFTACGGPARPSNEGVALDPGSEQAGHDASASSSQVVGHLVEVTPDAVLLDGQRFASELGGKVGRVDALFDALAGTEAPSAPEERLRNPVPYTLRAEEQVSAGWFKSVFQTAAFAGQAPAKLAFGEETLTVRPLVLLPPGSADAAVDPPWPDPVLVVLVHEGRTELWRASLPPEAGGARPADADPVARQHPEATLDELRFAFDETCKRTPCSPALLFVESPVPFSRMSRVLHAFSASVRAAGEPNPVVEFRIHEPSALPNPPRAPARVRMGVTTVSGKLPPAVIQSTVRANYGAIRKCYQAGLENDPELTGRIEVRFVIGRDGTVSNVESANGDLPAPVLDCVLGAFGKLVFPKPEGGVVTVVYPIVFAPE